jgi:outer membrane receptor for Fe3+-dicitrate
VENLLDRRYRFDYVSSGCRVSAPRILQLGLRCRSAAAG